MTITFALPMLPLDDIVVLPGMVVPVQLSDTEVRAAVEAAQASQEPDATEQARVLLVPRLDVAGAKASADGAVGRSRTRRRGRSLRVRRQAQPCIAQKSGRIQARDGGQKGRRMVRA